MAHIVSEKKDLSRSLIGTLSDDEAEGLRKSVAETRKSLNEAVVKRARKVFA